MCVCVEIEMILEVVLGFVLLCSKLPPIKKRQGPAAANKLDRSCAAPKVVVVVVLVVDR